MTADKFLEICRQGGLKIAVNYDDYTISIAGDAKSAAYAQRKLDSSPELTASVLVKLMETDAILKDLLTERAAIRAAEGLPDDLYSAALVNVKAENEVKDCKAKPSETKFHIFEVEDKRGERFKYSISCIDEVLQDTLNSLGLRVISEIEPHIWIIDSNTGIGSYQPVSRASACRQS